MRKALAGISEMSIRLRTAAVLVAVLCLSAATLGVVSLSQQRAALEREMQRRVASTLGYLSRAARRNFDRGDAEKQAANLARLRRRADVVSAVILDPKGGIIASYDASRPDPVAAPLDPPAVAMDSVVFSHSRKDGEGILEASAPIRRVGPGPDLGSIRVAFSKRPLEAALAKQKKTFLMVIAAFLAAGVVLSLVLSELLTRRVVRRLREKSHMERFLSQSTLQLVKRMSRSERLILGGERRHVAVLFADIRGFTRMSEVLPAEEVVEALNVYLHTQAEVIYKRGGVVDKFIGDQIMAIFSGKDAEFRAALSAQEICNFVASLNETRRRAGKELMTVGVGLNAGTVIMGNMGSERQMDYTAVGDPINVASHLCGQARPGQAVMSWPMLSAIAGRCRWGMLPFMVVKGKKDPVEVYDLRDVPGAARRHMRREMDHDAAVILGADERYSGKVRDLSRGGCSIELPFPIDIGKGLTVEFSPDFLSQGGISAVVQNLKKREGFYRIGVRFSGLTDKAAHAITEWVHHIEIDLTSQPT